MKNRDLNHIKSAYFIGIGGIGMSAIARYFNNQNIVVSGYDINQSALCLALEKEGIRIHYKEDLDLIPKEVDIVIYTPAIPKDHIELSWYENSDVTLVKRAEILGWISQDKTCLAVAGTHGKTSTSSILTHILVESKLHPSAFVGGIMSNYDTNFIYGEGDLVVVEADEFDRSFLHLYPDILLLMNMDADHLDIYGTYEDMCACYEQFTEQVKPGGHIVTKQNVIDKFSSNWERKLKEKQVKVIILDEDGSNGYQNINIEKGQYLFDLKLGLTHFQRLKSNMPGKHNVENASAAIVCASLLKANHDSIQQALSSFKGIKRRFEFVFKNERYTLIDDYAHHPEELEAAVKTVKDLYPSQRIAVIFQPHLYSRTLDFHTGFAKALESIDEILLLPIYPAREEPIEGVSSLIIFDIIKNFNKYFLDKQELIRKLQEISFDVIMTIGAANLETLHHDIIEVLSGTNEKRYST